MQDIEMRCYRIIMIDPMTKSSCNEEQCSSLDKPLNMSPTSRASNQSVSWCSGRETVGVENTP